VNQVPGARALAAIGMPILRTTRGTRLLEGVSLTRINSRKVALGLPIRANEEASRQVEEVLAAQGVELICVDGAFVMPDINTTMVKADTLPWWSLQKLEQFGIRTIEITPELDPRLHPPPASRAIQLESLLRGRRGLHPACPRGT
jgi:hypothetical protein